MAHIHHLDDAGPTREADGLPSPPKPQSREEWLMALVEKLRPRFAEAGSPLPDKLRVSPGWPHKGTVSRKRWRAGECWSPKASRDGTTEIFLSPRLEDDLTVAGVLMHELVHAAVGPEHGHKSPFVALGKALGLEGKPSELEPGADLRSELVVILLGLGRYPGAFLDMIPKDKKQTTRMIKATCLEHGYTVRVTRKWLEVAPPLCPICKTSMETDD